MEVPLPSLLLDNTSLFQEESLDVPPTGLKAEVKVHVHVLALCKKRTGGVNKQEDKQTTNRKTKED